MRSRYRKILIAAGAALASMALLASAAQAATPAPPYEDFAGCPSEAENPFVASCLKFQFTGGHITLGSREVPITNTIVMRGATEQLTAKWLQNSEGGMTPVKQVVPGGLIGLTGKKWLDTLSEKYLKLYAVVELAGQPGSVSTPTFGLPIKVHLENPLLGKGCYIGSNANPIQLQLTVGTTSPPPPNHPITGNKTTLLEPEEARPEVLTGTGGLYVDNAYSVPGANGCQLELFPEAIDIDDWVNAAYHLPAAAGTNETKLEFGRSVVSPEVIYP